MEEASKSTMAIGFIFQQDGSPAHMAELAQDFLATNCSELIDKDEWPPNSPDLNTLGYHGWRAMLGGYKTFHPKSNNIEELKNVLQVIWDQLPQVSINKATVSLTKRVRACLKVGGRDFEHA